MLTDDFKTITYLDASFQSSVMASTRYLGCRVQHASNGSSHIALMPTGVVLTTATETWHVVAELDLRANVYQALCQNNRITVRLPNGRIAHWVADKLERIHTHDLMIALACFIEQGYEHLDAMTLALAWLTQQACAAGAAWPQERRWFPRPRFANDHEMAENAEFSPIRKALFTLYPVVDTVEWLALVLEQGVTTAQLRIKDPNDPQLTHKIQQAIALGEQHGAQVFINDYWQLAIELGAYGVHLGQEDIEVADLSAIQAAGLRLGISTHGYFEIMRAFNLKPSYIALGHIFPTVTKDMPSQPQGLTRLGQYVALINGAYPTVAIGGINAERLPQVKATGVDSIALVTAITRSAEPELATRTLLAAVTETGDSHATVCE